MKDFHQHQISNENISHLIPMTDVDTVGFRHLNHIKSNVVSLYFENSASEF